MRLQFNLIVSGNQNLKNKFEQTISENPRLYMDLIQSFGQSVMLCFRLNSEDEISIESFKAGEIPPNTNQNLPEENNSINENENKVEN